MVVLPYGDPLATGRRKESKVRLAAPPLPPPQREPSDDQNEAESERRYQRETGERQGPGSADAGNSDGGSLARDASAGRVLLGLRLLMRLRLRRVLIGRRGLVDRDDQRVLHRYLLHGVIRALCARGCVAHATERCERPKDERRCRSGECNSRPGSARARREWLSEHPLGKFGNELSS